MKFTNTHEREVDSKLLVYLHGSGFSAELQFQTFTAGCIIHPKGNIKKYLLRGFKIIILLKHLTMYNINLMRQNYPHQMKGKIFKTNYDQEQFQGLTVKTVSQF